jgi:hypothetical protein
MSRQECEVDETQAKLMTVAVMRDTAVVTLSWHASRTTNTVATVAHIPPRRSSDIAMEWIRVRVCAAAS